MLNRVLICDEKVYRLVFCFNLSISSEQSTFNYFKTAHSNYRDGDESLLSYLFRIEEIFQQKLHYDFFQFFLDDHNGECANSTAVQKLG